MNCAWDAFLTLIPHWMRREVHYSGKDKLLELRLRIGLPPELIFPDCNQILDQNASEDDLSFPINVASKYSPWSASTLAQGFITAQGGHRLGICGQYIDSEHSAGIKHPSMINIRVARDVPDVSKDLYKENGSVLILGRPGSGKTTLLRDLIRKKSTASSDSVSVVDERQELFPTWNSQHCFFPGPRTDVLSGCRKSMGILMMLKNMTPAVIAVDEITEEDDCDAILKAGWCGVSVYATAHASSVKDLHSRPVYRPILESGLFEYVVVMHWDKTWHLERIC